MPRPSTGYRNAAGLVVPGTHDVTGRFSDKRGLINWAYKRGRDGAELYDTGAINIGTVTHMCAEMSLKGATIDDIDGYLDRTPIDTEDRRKVETCFRGFHQWQVANPILPVLQETPLISEQYQYGGTPDLIGMTRAGLAIVDPKTSKDGTPYPEMPVVLAAHGRLWLENNPSKPLTGGYHLLLLPKDGSPFRHISYTQEHMDRLFWPAFAGMRALYDLDKACSKREALEGIAFPSPTPQTVASVHRLRDDKPAAKPRRKPPERVSYQPRVPMSMAEILRSYGHVGAVA